MASKKEEYPAPLKIPSQSGKHSQTFIILHGRGDNAQDFGPDLLDCNLKGLGTLPDLFPKAKFIFPTASKRRMKRFGNETATQWFDMWAVDRPDEKLETQLEGLQESVLYVHGLLETAAGIVGGKNVVLWGMSQGCATSLIASLLWTGETLGAVVGMCGWLPLLERMRAVLVAPAMDDQHLYQDEAASKLPIDKVVESLRKELQLPSSDASTNALDTPVFLGHGVEDDKVPVHLGEEAEEFLKDLGINVRLAQYGGLDHWYAGEMLRHIVEFIACEAGWPVKEP